MTPQVKAVMDHLEAKCKGPEPEGHKLTAINWASLWTLIQKYGPQLIQIIIGMIPANTPADKVASVVLATLNQMKLEGLIAE